MTATKPEVLAELRQLAVVEQALYLKSRTEERLRSGHPFDLTHQTLLRLAVMHGIWPRPEAGLVAQYFFDPASRSRLRDDILSVLPEPDRMQWESEERMHYSGTPAKLSDAFRDLLDTQNPRAFAHRYGFGLFEPVGARQPNGLVLVDTPNAASVGGLMFYGFSGGQREEHYVQELSARLLACTMAVLSDSTVPDVRSDWTIDGVRQELVGVGSRYQALEERADKLTTACIDFLSMHERGHALIGKDAPLTTTMLTKHIGVIELARVLASPDADQLAAWPRLDAGTDLRPHDVAFLYGDYLANLAGLEGGIAADSLAALRAYNWWFVPQDRPVTRRPRGDLVFLALNGQDYVARGLAEIDRILSAPPAAWSSEMRSLELWAWDELQARCAQA